MFRFWFSSRGRAGRRGRSFALRSSHAIMSISRRASRESEPELCLDSLSFVVSEARVALAAEYVARSERLFSRLRAPPPAPRHLARELTESILYESAGRIDTALKSVTSGDSLWNGRPQQYFESMNYAENDNTNEIDCDNDSLAP